MYLQKVIGQKTLEKNTLLASCQPLTKRAESGVMFWSAWFSLLKVVRPSRPRNKSIGLMKNFGFFCLNWKIYIFWSWNSWNRICIFSALTKKNLIRTCIEINMYHTLIVTGTYVICNNMSTLRWKISWTVKLFIFINKCLSEADLINKSKATDPQDR